MSSPIKYCVIISNFSFRTGCKTVQSFQKINSVHMRQNKILNCSSICQWFPTIYTDFEDHCKFLQGQGWKGTAPTIPQEPRGLFPYLGSQGGCLQVSLFCGFHQCSNKAPICAQKRTFSFCVKTGSVLLNANWGFFAVLGRSAEGAVCLPNPAGGPLNHAGKRTSPWVPMLPWSLWCYQGPLYRGNDPVKVPLLYILSWEETPLNIA